MGQFSGTLGNGSNTYLKIVLTFLLTAVLGLGAVGFKLHQNVATFKEFMESKLSGVADRVTTVSDRVTVVDGRVNLIESNRFTDDMGDALEGATLVLTGKVEALSTQIQIQSVEQNRLIATIERISGTLGESAIRMKQLEEKKIPPEEVLLRLDSVEESVEKMDRRHGGRLDKIDARYDRLVEKLLNRLVRVEPEGFFRNPPSGSNNPPSLRSDD